MIANSKNTEQIISAAVRLFRENGYADTTVRDICRSSKVSSSSFYSVFSGKDEVLISVLRGYEDNFEETMLKLLQTDTSIEKLWILYGKYLRLAQSLGPELLAALYKLELDGRFSFIASVNEYLSRYLSFFVRFIEDSQRAGIIRNPGKASELMPMGVRLTYFLLLEWCASRGSFSLTERAHEEMESFYDVEPSFRGLGGAE